MTKKHDFLDNLPDGVDREKVEMQLDWLVKAIWQQAEEEVIAEHEAAQKAKPQPTNTKSTADPQE